MWGNSLGWSISAVIVLLCGATVYLVATSSAPTQPTAFSTDQSNFAPIILPTPPDDALSRNEPPVADPITLYRNAIDLCDSQKSIYENFAQFGKLDSTAIAQLKAIDALVGASAASKVDLFTTTPQRIITYAHTKSDIDALQLLGRVCVDRLGLLNARAGNLEQALKYYHAAFILGQDLCQERLSYDEFELGMELIAKSSAAIASLDEKKSDTALTAAWQTFNAARMDLMQRRIDPVLHIVRSIDAKVVGEHTGDLFELAKRSRERMWRVEAILALGRVRYFAGEGGTAANQRNAMRLLRDFADNDPDPIIRTAATAARDLTIEQYRMQ